MNRAIPANGSHKHDSLLQPGTIISCISSRKPLVLVKNTYVFNVFDQNHARSNHNLRLSQHHIVITIHFDSCRCLEYYNYAGVQLVFYEDVLVSGAGNQLLPMLDLMMTNPAQKVLLLFCKQRASGPGFDYSNSMQTGPPSFPVCIRFKPSTSCWAHLT